MRSRWDAAEAAGGTAGGATARALRGVAVGGLGAMCQPLLACIVAAFTGPDPEPRRPPEGRVFVAVRRVVSPLFLPGVAESDPSVQWLHELRMRSSWAEGTRTRAAALSLLDFDFFDRAALVVAGGTF